MRYEHDWNQVSSPKNKSHIFITLNPYIGLLERDPGGQNEGKTARQLPLVSLLGHSQANSQAVN